MEMTFVLRQFEASEELKSFIEQKVRKRLEGLLNGNSEVRVILATEKAWTTVEVVVTSRGEVFKASEKTADEIEPAVDGVLDKVERQVQRHKDLLHERRKARN